MSNKKEVAVIDFTKFDIQQLPELHGKKEEIKKVIKENPVVKVTDNASYELAKKSRTAVKTLRTSLEKEKKEVNDRIKKNVLEVVSNEYDSLIADVKNNENARQEEVSAWEEKKEQERLEKLRLEQERVDGIKSKIFEFGQVWEQAFSLMKFENIEEAKNTFNESVSVVNPSEFQEFEVLFTDKVSYLTNLLETRIATLTEQENVRLAKIELEKEQEKQRIAAEKVAEEQRIAQENFLKEKKEFEEKQLKARTETRIKQLTDLGIHEDVIYDELGNGQWRNHKALSETCTDEMWAEHLEWTKQQIELRNKKQEIAVPTLLTEEDAFKPNESVDEKAIVFEIDGDDITIAESYIEEGRLVERDGILIDTTTGKPFESTNFNHHEDDVDPKGIENKNFKSGEEVEFHPKEISEAETPIVFDALGDEQEKEFYTGNFKNLSKEIVSFELVFSINDLPKFENMTLKEFLEPYNVPTRKQQ